MQLWEQGYTQGLTISGVRVAKYTATFAVAYLMSGWLRQIITTTIKLAAKALVAGMAIALGDNGRAEMIAVTEVNRAIEQAKADAFHQQGTALVRWVTGGPNPCELCIANEAQGPHPLGEPFVSGALTPPQHPNCRCHLEKA